MSEAGELNGLDDDYGLDDVDRFSETGVETHAYQEESTEDAARKQWLEQPWEQKWKEVLKLLAASQVRWDQSGDSHLTILEDYKKESLVSKNPYGATRPTVLHELAKDFECSDFHKIPVETQLKVMRFLLQHMQQRAPTEGFNQIQQEDPILEVAMLTDNHALLHYLTEKCTDSLVELLDAHGQSGMNPLHYAFRTHLADALKHVETVRREKLRPVKKNLTLSVFLKLLRKFILNAKAETVVAQDSAGNTTIHYALGYDLCRLENSFYMDKIVRPLVEKGDTIFLKRQHARQFNKAEQSPYLYYEHTEKTWKREHHVPIRTSVTKSRYYDEGKGPEDSKREPLVADTRMGDDKRRAKELAGKGETEYRDMSLVQDPKLTRKEKQNATQHGVADKMLEAHGPLRSTDKSISSPVMGKGADTVSFTKRNVSSLVPPQNTLMMTATQSRAPKSVGEASNGDKQSATKIDPQIAAANIHTYLKLHYIRTRADMEAKELLYGKVASGKFSPSSLCGNTWHGRLY